MQGFAERKAGKLVRVSVRFGERIEDVTISGDFFIHPEESLQLIEDCLWGMDVNEDIVSRVSDAVKTNDIELIGVTPEVLAETIKEAIKNGRETAT